MLQLKGGFLIPQDKVNKLVEHKNLLTEKQKKQILTALQSGGKLVIKSTLKQRGGFLGTLLASIGISMLIKAITGNGLRNRYYQVPRAPRRVSPPKPKKTLVLDYKTVLIPIC